MPLPATYCHADLEIRTRWGLRKSRLYYAFGASLPSQYNHIQAFANALHDKWGTIIKPLMSMTNSLERVTVRFRNVGVDLQAPSTAAPTMGTADASGITEEIPLSGGVWPDSMPDDCALIFQRITGVTGRKSRGRWFMPGLSETVNTSGKINTSLADEVIAVAEQATDGLAIDFPAEGTDIAWETMAFFQHYNRVDNILMPVIKVLAIDAIGSRMDRRSPMDMSVLVDS